MAQIRKKEIRRRRQRKERLGKLKNQLKEAKNQKERDRLIELILKRDPFFQQIKEK